MNCFTLHFHESWAAAALAALAGVGRRAKNMACIFYQEGMDEKRRKEDAGRIKYIVAGHTHSIPARELEEPNRRCGKSCYHWSRGLSSSSSARPEGRHPREQENTRTLHYL